MCKSKQIGKVVCVLPHFKKLYGNITVHTPLFHENATYLITGGLGGVGLEICKWMLKMGAEYIILVGRSPPNSKISGIIGKINTKYNSRVTTMSLDASRLEQCKELINFKIEEIGYPHLRGVMHAAGTLQDGFVRNHTWQSFSRPFDCKVSGTLNLHQLTKNNSQLEHFILFSSIAALFGTPGHSNYTAGNYFQDIMAQHRHSVGLPATSINWGQWGQVGIATDVDLPGMKPLSTAQALASLEYALKSHRPQTAVINIESFSLMEKWYPQILLYVDQAAWTSVVSVKHTDAGSMNTADFWKLYESKETPEEKIEIVKDQVARTLHHILRHDTIEVVDENVEFEELGVYSLMFVEVKNALQALLEDKLSLNVNTLRESNTVVLLAVSLVRMIQESEEIKQIE